jgi:hypothetical protein
MVLLAAIVLLTIVPQTRDPNGRCVYLFLLGQGAQYSILYALHNWEILGIAMVSFLFLESINFLQSNFKN